MVAGRRRQGQPGGDLTGRLGVQRLHDDLAKAQIQGDDGNKCDELERITISEFYQRAFGEEISDSLTNAAVA